MDLQMPNTTGVQAARTIWAEKPTLPILFWSNYADEAYVRGITKIVPTATTYGYLLKTSSKERLRRSMQCVFLEGQNIIDREIRGVQQRGTNQHAKAVGGRVRGPARHCDRADRPGHRASAQYLDPQRAGPAAATLCEAGLLEGPTLDGHTALYNSRTRSIALALTPADQRQVARNWPSRNIAAGPRATPTRRGAADAGPPRSAPPRSGRSRPSARRWSVTGSPWPKLDAPRT